MHAAIVLKLASSVHVQAMPSVQMHIHLTSIERKFLDIKSQHAADNAGELLKKTRGLRLL